jgi:hypothetical protein
VPLGVVLKRERKGKEVLYAYKTTKKVKKTKL